MTTQQRIDDERNSGPSESDVADAAVRAVATERGVDPLALPQLYDAVEPDAVGALVDSVHDAARVEFSYAGCRVSIRGDGEIAVESNPDDGLEDAAARDE